jgi:hypothetical protein
MTVNELIDQLLNHPLDTPVRVVVEDEVDSSPPADIYGVTRVVDHPGGPYIEIGASL